MSDDIVTRLRFEYASCECSGINHDCDRCKTDKQAADEIERLRKQLTLAYGRTCRCVNTEARNESR